jgi:predicted PurR-regulated permease PerM
MPKSSKILLAVAILVTAVIVVIVYLSSSVLVQLFIAFALAYILNPAVSLLERRGVRRVPAILIVFIAAVLATTGFTAFLIGSISSELSDMRPNLPAYATHIYEVTPETIKNYLGIETPDKLSQRVDQLIQQARTSAPDMLKPVAAFIKEAFSSTINLILAILGYLIIPVYLFYLLSDMPRLKQFAESFIPERHLPAYRQKLEEIDAVLSGFIRGQLLVCAILAVLYSVGLYFIGIDLAIAIGTLAGVTFIIPYLGTLIGITLSGIMAFLKFHDILHPLLCLGWFSIVQGLEGAVITPKIVGNKVGLHPLVAIIALLIGGQLFGLIGMLIAVPVTAVLQVFTRSFADYYRSSEFYRGA